MKRLAILGASGHGKVVADAALQMGWHDIVICDDAYPARTQLGSWPVVGTAEGLLAREVECSAFIVAIGDNATRLQRHRELAEAGLMPATVVHPAATVSLSARLGAGSVVCAGAVVNPGAELGEACIVNTCASVDHDCVLGEAVHVSPGAHLGGGVHVGERSWVGIGAAVRHGVTIGARTMVGAGAAVVDDVPDDVTVIGVPARLMHRGEEAR